MSDTIDFDEVRYRLRKPQFLASAAERSALVAIIREAPHRFDNSDEALDQLLTDYRSKEVGKGRW